MQSLFNHQNCWHSVPHSSQPCMHGHPLVHGANATSPTRIQRVSRRRAFQRPYTAPACLATTQTPPSVPYGFSFPHQPMMEFEGRQVPSADMIALLEPFLTAERLARIDHLVQRRHYGVVPVLENTYDMGNLAAVCRSADALGFGAIHYIMRSDEKYKQSARSSAGADKWLDVRLWDSTAAAVAAVKAAGFQLVVTHLSKSSITLQEIDFLRPTAIVLGNERFGATDEVVAAADHCAIIPMSGMVESLNISVAAACCMYEAQQQRARAGLTGDLSQEQQQTLKAQLMMRSVREPSTLLTELLSRPPPQWQSGRLKKVKTIEAI